MFRNRRYNTIHRTTRSITVQLLRPTKTIRRYTYSRLYAIIYDHGSRLVTIGNSSYHSNDQRSGYFFLSAFYLLELWINLYSLYFRRLEGSRQ
jgi:hypothetical protein